MKYAAKHLAAALLTAAVFAATAADEQAVDDTKWSFFEQVDKITDDVSYVISTVANESRNSARREIFGDETRIVVHIFPKGRTSTNGMKFDRTIFLYHSDTSLGIDKTKITTRFDREKATSALWSTIPPSYNIAVAPDSASMFKKLQASTNLIVRFSSVIGETKTLTFDIGGLTNALHAVKLKYLATNPPIISDAKPSPTSAQPVADPQPDSSSKLAPSRKPSPPCRKCNGKRTISGWVTCPKCGGQRCNHCIKSVHVGKIRGEIPCPDCATPARR